MSYSNPLCALTQERREALLVISRSNQLLLVTNVFVNVPIYPPQGNPPQGYPPQVYPQQGFPPQGYPLEGFPPQGYPPQGFPPQGYPPQGYQGLPS